MRFSKLVDFDNYIYFVVNKTDDEKDSDENHNIAGALIWYSALALIFGGAIYLFNIN
jgi:hypothetical protein